MNDAFQMYNLSTTALKSARKATDVCRTDKDSSSGRRERNIRGGMAAAFNLFGIAQYDMIVLVHLIGAFPLNHHYHCAAALTT